MQTWILASLEIMLAKGLVGTLSSLAIYSSQLLCFCFMSVAISGKFPHPGA